MNVSRLTAHGASANDSMVTRSYCRNCALLITAALNTHAGTFFTASHVAMLSLLKYVACICYKILCCSRVPSSCRMGGKHIKHDVCMHRCLLTPAGCNQMTLRSNLLHSVSNEHTRKERNAMPFRPEKSPGSSEPKAPPGFSASILYQQHAANAD